MAILDLDSYRDRRVQHEQNSEFLAALWARYDDVVVEISTFPDWMLLKIMSACRTKLR